jgi:hypothetical protein
MWREHAGLSVTDGSQKQAMMALVCSAFVFGARLVGTSEHSFDIPADVFRRVRRERHGNPDSDRLQNRKPTNSMSQLVRDLNRHGGGSRRTFDQRGLLLLGRAWKCAAKALGFAPDLFHEASELCRLDDDNEDHR